MTKKSTAAAFLENMKVAEPVETPATPAPEKKSQGRGKAPVASRVGLKHIGGYCTSETVEQFAILRARLGLDNSECLTLAIRELYAKQKAKKAFDEQ